MSLGLAPIVYDPFGDLADRYALYESAVALCRAWSAAHELPPVEYRDSRLARYHGLYAPGRRVPRILVDVRRARVPARTPGYSWSYPGYKADLTAAGVTAHELGHHVWATVRAESSREGWQRHVVAWREARRDEAPVSSYEPILEETFTEAFKVFLLNPDLLRLGRPVRYGLLLSSGLVRAHDMPWQEVMGRAHPLWHGAAENWIKKGKAAAVLSRPAGI